MTDDKKDVVSVSIPDEDDGVFYSPEPPAHVQNLTPAKAQEPFKDHRDLVAEGQAAAAAYLKQVDEEWGKYVANQDIITPHGLVAYRQGTRVPVSNVKLHKYDVDGLVDEVKK